MTGDKILEVIDVYERRLDGLLKTLDWEDNNKLAHARTMCDSIRAFVKERRLEKAFRWLGFIQGVLWAEGIYTITEMKKHNQQDDREERAHGQN